MKFGVNEDVNYVKPSEQKEVDAIRSHLITVVPTTQKDVSQTERPSIIPKVDNDEINMLPTLGSAIAFGFLIAKYII